MVFDEVPVPEPGVGQVTVKVSGCGVNPVDWKIREGRYDPILGLPAIMGREFSGTVDRLGPDVSDFKVGDEVYGIAEGSCAEFVVASVDAMGLKPSSMDLPDAAAVPLAGMTAFQSLFDVANLQNGQRAVITAASGGVGTFAVQLAKWKGAYVIATTSSRNAHLVQEIGADEVIDYHKARFEEVVSDIDVILDATGGDTALKGLKALKLGGIVVSIASSAPVDEAVLEGKRAVRNRMVAKREDLDRLSALVQDLEVRPVIDTVVRFDQAIEAFKESQEGHAVGKIVIRVA
jgi:NADPH:quinone reductase-like Zn-dependent oxidoreductase